jgi:hypothetical protein
VAFNLQEIAMKPLAVLDCAGKATAATALSDGTAYLFTQHIPKRRRASLAAAVHNSSCYSSFGLRSSLWFRHSSFRQRHGGFDFPGSPD